MNAQLRLDILSCFRLGRDREHALFNFNLFSQLIHSENYFFCAPPLVHHYKCFLLNIAMVKTTIIRCRSQSLAFTTEINEGPSHSVFVFLTTFLRGRKMLQLSRLEFLESRLALIIGLNWLSITGSHVYILHNLEGWQKITP